MIRQLLVYDVYRIEAADPYADDYHATIDRNLREQYDNAGPGIANPRTRSATTTQSWSVAGSGTTERR
jgi:hypothetical protein